MRALARYVIAYREPMEKMAKMAAARSRSQILVRPPQSSEGVTFQQESFGAWVRDGKRLFAEHLVEVGEAPDNWKNKDLPLMKMMYDAGYMQITTARANGRMFGYLMAVLNPSLEVRGEFTGLHNTFYVSKDMPGIGVRLQRASLDALKARGARAALFYAGIRGDGPRMGALYRRLGAEEFGSLYRLELDNAD
jgi:GNAT superfamily N-acetyltransferase